MKAISITALAIVMAFASGCEPSKPKPTMRERFEATEKLLSAWEKDINGSRADYIRVLISEGAEVNAKDEYGMTPLLYATWKSSPEIVQLLIEKGADVNARNTDGRTPLTIAAMNPFGKSAAEMKQLLKAAGAIE